MEGYIKLHRSVLDWEWYDDGNTFRLFMHLLLKANHKEKKYRGINMKPGTVLTSRDILASETGLSVKQIRTALNKLKRAGDLAIDTSSQGTKIQVVNYSKYQHGASEEANEGPAKGQQRATNKNVKNVKNDKNNKNIKKIEIPVLSDSHKNDLFKEWLDYKKDLGKPIKTNQGMKQLAKQFEDNNSLLIRKNMDKSIANGWQGLFYDNNKSTGGNLAKDIVTSKLKELLPEPPKPDNYDTPEGQEYIRVFQHNLEVRRWNTKHVYKG